MRIATVSALLLTSSIAYAQSPQVSGANITEFGIYTSELVRAEPAPGAVAGHEKIVTNMRLAAQTRTIPAQKGVSFGYRFTLVGTPIGAIAPLHMVTIFPSPMTNPATHQSSAHSEGDIGLSIGATGYAGYSNGQRLGSAARNLDVSDLVPRA